MPKQFAAGLGDIQDTVLRTLLGTHCCVNPGLAIAATKSKVKTANDISYCIGGIFYSKAATDNLFVHTDLTVQAAGTTKYYALCLDKDGTASVIAGVTSAAFDGYSYSLPVGIPPIPSDKCCIGLLKIATDATHTFTPATTLNDAAGITASYINCGVLPATLP